MAAEYTEWDNTALHALVGKVLHDLDTGRGKWTYNELLPVVHAQEKFSGIKPSTIEKSLRENGSREVVCL